MASRVHFVRGGWTGTAPGWSGDGDAEPHRVAIGDEHERGATRLSADREDGESAAEERMGRVGYLDLVRERAEAGC